MFQDHRRGGDGAARARPLLKSFLFYFFRDYLTQES